MSSISKFFQYLLPIQKTIIIHQHGKGNYNVAQVEEWEQFNKLRAERDCAVKELARSWDRESKLLCTIREQEFQIQQLSAKRKK